MWCPDDEQYTEEEVDYIVFEQNENYERQFII